MIKYFIVTLNKPISSFIELNIPIPFSTNQVTLKKLSIIREHVYRIFYILGKRGIKKGIIETLGSDVVYKGFKDRSLFVIQSSSGGSHHL